MPKNVILFLFNRRCKNGSILREMPNQEGDEESEDDHHEEQAACYFRYMPELRHEDVQNR
jgi:hypothetical protein